MIRTLKHRGRGARTGAAAEGVATRARRSALATRSGVAMRSALAAGAALAALAGLAAAGPARVAAQAPVEWGGQRWRVEARDARLERHEGRDALLLENGIAWLEGSNLRDGTVRFDLHADDALGFHGVAFRARGDGDYEHFYLRPFLSGEPDASQYTPVFNGVSGWQIYAGPRYALPVEVPTGRWIRVELRFRDGRAEAYVEGEPLAFPGLERAPAAGAIGLTSSGTAARFADVLVTPATPALEAGTGAPAEAVPSGVVARWRVSTPFAESRLDSVAAPDPALVDGLTWEALASGPGGVANLARLRAPDAPTNTAFAAVTLRAARAGPVRVRFGYSDRVAVYLDGHPLYRGDAAWRSRDHRFLGTVGRFDELVLPIRAGDNELWLAVSEDFGGWGVTVRLLDREDVEIVARDRPDLIRGTAGVSAGPQGVQRHAPLRRAPPLEGRR